MDLFSPAALQKLMTEVMPKQPDVDHAFLQHLISPKSVQIRSRLSAMVQAASPILRDRWTQSLRSPDIRRFFQGYSEVTAGAFLQQAGWTLTGLSDPGPCIRVERQRENGEIVQARLMVLAFLHSTQAALKGRALSRLVSLLDNAETASRISILVRKWKAHKFDPLPIRRAIEHWLGEVKKGNQKGRYAHFENEHISLEFCLTAKKHRTSGGTVIFAIGPLDGLRTIEIVESRLVYELDRQGFNSADPTPLITCLSTNSVWPLSPGFLRGFLYGRPTSHLINGLPHREEFGFGQDVGPALFRDPLYQCVGATMVLEQAPNRGPCARTYLNPWAMQALLPTDTACTAFGLDRWEKQTPVMRWYK